MPGRVLLLLLLPLYGAPAAASASACLTVNETALVHTLQRSKCDEVLFFATWCASCRSHMRNRRDQALFVGAFDDAYHTEQGLRFIGYKGPCLVAESSMAKTLIKAVPARFRLISGQLVRVPL